MEDLQASSRASRQELSGERRRVLGSSRSAKARPATDPHRGVQRAAPSLTSPAIMSGRSADSQNRIGCERSTSESVPSPRMTS
jgi:hypothetical protein